MKLTEQQIDSLNEIEQLCFHGSWTKEMLLEELQNPLSVLAISQKDGRVVGFALGRVVADEGELYQIAVLPQHRREHLGSSLLSQLHNLMRERGAACCFLEVRSRNTPARRLYESHGYQEISLRKNYYSDDDAVIYKKEWLVTKH